LREAKAAYLEALQDRPGDPGLLKRLGDLCLYENRPEDAVRHLGEALERSSGPRRGWPLNVPIRAQLGMAHYRMDRFAAASEQFAVARLEFVVTDPLPALELSVNGGPPTLFLVDTGGAELVLDTRLAMEAGAEMVSSLNGEYSGRRKARTGLGRVGSIQAGDLRIHDVPVHTLDLGDLPRFLGIDVRGILGTRLLMHFLPTIDYPGGALILRRGPAPALQDPARTIPFWLADTHLILARGRLNGLPPTCFWVDTGLVGSGFLASETQLRTAGVAIDWSTAEEGPGGGGLVKEANVLIDSLTLGEGDEAITRAAVPGMVQDKPLSIFGDRLGFEVGGLISHAFFRPYALTIDFTNMCLLLA